VVADDRESVHTRSANDPGGKPEWAEVVAAASGQITIV